MESRQSLTNGMLAIRNNAFGQLGDTNLADSVDSGHAPAFTVTDTKALVSSTGAALTQVDGTVQVPCYLVTCGPSTQPGFHYSSSKPDVLPTQIPGNVATATFECIVPSSATAPTPARISLYGHGLLGSEKEVQAGPARVDGDRAQHGLLRDGLHGPGRTATRATTPQPWRTSTCSRRSSTACNRGCSTCCSWDVCCCTRVGWPPSAFRSDGRPVIDTSHLYYDGNSQGGILGGMTDRVAPDFARRARRVRHELLHPAGSAAPTSRCSPGSCTPPIRTVPDPLFIDSCSRCGTAATPTATPRR